jgi:hypothetical protein
MKISLALGLSLTLGTFALVGAAPNTAHAVNATHSGTVCKNYNAAEAKDIDYLGSGVRNVNASPRFVVCPLIRLPDSGGGIAPTAVSAYVTGFAASGQTIACTMYGVDYSGNFLGSESTAPMTGQFGTVLYVPENIWSSADLVCELPASGNGLIYQIQVNDSYPIQ